MCINLQHTFQIAENQNFTEKFSLCFDLSSEFNLYFQHLVKLLRKHICTLHKSINTVKIFPEKFKDPISLEIKILLVYLLVILATGASW